MSTDTKNTKLNQLLEAATLVARSESRAPEDVLADALTQYERNKKLAELGAYGRDQAQRMGLKLSDIEKEITAARRR